MVTTPRRMASLASRLRRCSSWGAIPNLLNRFVRCCFTAASLIASSVAIARVEAGSVNMSRARTGRQSATRTSRSRVVTLGGASSTSVGGCRASGSRNMSWVCPTRISSPSRRDCRDQMRSPLIQVPLDDPRSVMHQPALNRSKVACMWLTVGSSTARSFWGALPTVIRSSSRQIRRAECPAMISSSEATVRSVRETRASVWGSWHG
jgi:hypothetical protein